MTQPTHEDFRTAGFPGDAATYPRDELALRMFAAFNGVTVEQLPDPFKFFPNEATQRAWSRVAAAAIDHCSTRSVSDYVKAVEQERDDARLSAQSSADELGNEINRLVREKDAAQSLIRTLEEENSNLRKAMEWQDIGTAPKDGTRFLATHEKSGVSAITWHGKTSHVPLYGWCHGEDAEEIDLWKPTHWMPLPSPPALQSKSTEESK